MPTTALSPGLTLLGGSPDRIALVSGAERITYGELADRVDARRAELGDGRRLVMLQAAHISNVEQETAFNAALSAFLAAHA